MDVATLVLLHSPFVTAQTWGELPSVLAQLGHAVVVVEVVDDDHPPYAATYVARAAQQIGRAAPAAPLVLVGHSGAGPLLPQVGESQRAARRPVAAYVFLDATLPRAGASRLDLLHARDEALAHQTRAELERGALAPTWTDADLSASGLDAHQRVTALAALRPRGLAFFEEVVPSPGDWPDAPCIYVQTSAGAAGVARLARLRGFEVVESGGGHLAALVDPTGLARTLHSVVIDL